jgi:hypothetical protein
MSKAAKGKGTAVVEEAPPEPVAGKGEFLMPDGSKYVGDYLDTAGVKCRNGQGTSTLDSETYVGGWVNDAMTGEGEYTFASGAVYRGSFANNLFDGLGSYTFPDGTSYTGSWKGNKMHGHGTYTHSDGMTSVGEFANGVYKTGQRSTQQDLPPLVQE